VIAEGNVIETENLFFGYRPGENILEDVTLQIPAGRSASIVGPNGGGKSTLLKVMLGMLTPSSGRVRLFGAAPAESRLRVGYMPQYHLLDTAFPVTVLEVVMMGRMRGIGKLFYSRRDREAAMAALEEVGMADFCKRGFAELSGGQRQRVLIARAIAGEPDLLLLDEPTANIDPGAGEQFYATLEELRNRMTVLTVSHDLGFVNREIDMIICVNRRVTVHQAADFTAEAVDEIYHHRVNMVQHDHSCFCRCGEGAAAEVHDNSHCGCGCCHGEEK